MNHNYDKHLNIEPYKVLFPLGILCAFIGIFFWLLFQIHMINFYPRESHGNLMYFGFIWAFIAGFLMTAVPKMTSTFAATLLEISIALSLSFLQIALAIRNEGQASSYLTVLQFTFLLYFLARRFLKSKKIPFSGFIFIPIAISIALAGVGIFIANNDRSLLLLFSGEAFILNLILGLGGRLIPVISRLPNSLMPNQNSNVPETYLNTIIFALLFNMTYIVQVFGQTNIAILARTIILIYAIFKFFKISQKPVKWTAVGIGLKISAVLLPLGTLLSTPLFNNPLAGAHVLYIGGFVLMTLLISTRVVLAHGGESLNYEISSKRVITFSLCLVAASFLRLLSGSNVTSAFMQLSIMFFLVSIAAWTLKILSRYSNQE